MGSNFSSSTPSQQFLIYTLSHKNPDGRGVKRYFTIATAPYEKLVMLTARFSKRNPSTFKKALFAMKPGEEIEAGGPQPMVRAFEETLAGIGVPGGNIRLDFFPGYEWP